jgi:hypothetical protein
MQDLLTPESKVMGERSDYFDLWTTVLVTGIRKTKKDGVLVTEEYPVAVNIGCEFRDFGDGFEHIRQNLGTFERQSGTFWDRLLGRGCNIADWMPKTGWRLFFGNSLWNRPAEA